MFTWNFQYISKARLAEAFNQLMLDPRKGDILVRIHTAIHLEEEAVDLAGFISHLVPEAHIFGTSTSAVISWGKISQNQCVVSVTQMSGGTVKTALLPTFDDNDMPIAPDVLCENIRNAVVSDDTKLLLTFLTRRYHDVFSLVDKCNDYFPDVQMIGGLANTSDISLKEFLASGFVFNEKGWSNKGILLAAIGGDRVESCTSYASGVQVIGREFVVTDTAGKCILTIDGKDAAEQYVSGVGDNLRKRSELANLFPYVYSNNMNMPIHVSFTEEKSIRDILSDSPYAIRAVTASHPDLDIDSPHALITANHNVNVGMKLKRAFIYDKKIIADNYALFRRIENFEKAETIFGYNCVARSAIYSNCVKWELSAYENTNICGCLTEGEITCVNGRNTFTNCTFVVSVIGEEPATQEYNPFAFTYTDSLVDDNRELINYLYEIEEQLSQSEQASETLREFIRDCELKLLHNDDDIPNAAAMNMDIKLKGYDRICMINVFDITSMETVFTKHMINLTYRNYITNCVKFAKNHNYNIYLIDKWHVAIGAPSYMVALSEFVSDMETLQHILFEATEEYIAIVPMFCVIDDCTVDNVSQVYYSARVEMMQKNIQFYVRDAKYGQLDEESIRERYHMVNVINYAISHNKVIPYYQGIYDNEKKHIHHYESLMRLEDENGRIYYPGSFLDVARSYGLLYDSLSSLMIHKVFERFRLIEDTSVSLNLSIRDIKNRDLVEYIFEFLSTARHPENFVFEILENEDIDNYDELIAFVDRIHDLGALISIDDFGSGFSNLIHIANIHSDYLKIDGSIVKRCCDDKESENLIALISNWRKLIGRDIRIIAEFVENESIQMKLLDYKIDFSQGYLFSKPSPDLNI